MVPETQTSVSAQRKVCPLVLRNSKPSFLAPSLNQLQSFQLETNIFLHYLFAFLNLDKNIKIADDCQAVIIEHTPLRYLLAPR